MLLGVIAERVCISAEDLLLVLRCFVSNASEWLTSRLICFDDGLLRHWPFISIFAQTFRYRGCMGNDGCDRIIRTVLTSYLAISHSSNSGMASLLGSL